MARAETKKQDGGGKALVIVESPTKANTLRKYLGGSFLVEASIGHVRDLAERKSDLAESDPRRSKPWVKYGVNVENHFEPLEEIYLIPPEKKRQVDTLKQALGKVDALYLATDDDREGEAISWHLLEVLKPKVPVQRMVFHEITREAVDKALHQPRALDENLVAAQRTRRVVDRLFGWDVSEVLWRKIKPGLSAGRVQSVALRLLVQRERERMAFVSTSYWDVLARLQAAAGEAFEAHLWKVGARRIASGKDFDDTTGKLTATDVVLLDEAGAHALVERLQGRPAKVLDTQVKPQTLRPYPPFTTSTLQQEANRKLRFSARQTMQVAQRLYENGFITYMRTDSTTLSDQALTAARTLIGEQYGREYLPPQPRRYQTRSANAQEAHEAIRPAGTQFPTFHDVARELGPEAEKLYELIWKRTVASQMVDAQVEQTSVDIGVDDVTFRASGRVTRFAGFLKAYVEGTDDPDAALADRDKALPPLRTGDTLRWGAPPALDARGHTTRPPARLTDASLVKSLEEKGIGRPSTYAAILQNLLDKHYAFRRGGQALVPTFMGMAVVRMLEKHMPHLVDYNFTAEMESRLDAIARGEAQCGTYLRSFYEEGFQGLQGDGPVRGLTDLLHDVRDHIDPAEASSVPIGQTPAGDAVVVRIGKFGTFVKVGDHTANVPDDLAPDEMTVAKAVELVEARQKGEAPLGFDPDSKDPIFLRNGRFGWYLQRGVATKDGDKPKMISLSKGMKPEEITLEKAILQLTLPRTLGKYPRNGEPIVATAGRYGDYVKAGDETRTLPTTLAAATVTLEQASAVLDKPRAVAGKEHVRDIGVRPRDGKLLQVYTGRYGPFVTDGTVNKTLPDDVDLEAVTVEQADGMLQAALEARTGRLVGVDPASGREVRLIDGRFGPYLTDGETNASVARGMGKEEVTLVEALDRLKHFGKPVKKKKGARKATARPAAKKAGTDKAAPKTAAAKTAAAKKPATKAAKAKAAPKTGAAKSVTAPGNGAVVPKGPETVSRRSQVREEPKAAAPAPVVRRRPAAPGA